MGKSSPPKPPDPRETSSATTGTNVSTSIANAFLQNPNETTPWGMKTVTPGAEYTWTDPYTGEEYTVPQFNVSQTLAPAQQEILDQQTRADINLSTLGADLSGQLHGKLTDNFALGNEATESRLFDLGRRRLDPRFAEGREALQTRLANQGIMQGSAAYDREMRNFGQQENDAYNQLLLQGRGLANQELLTEDNQRINQISALLAGGQVTQPNFMTGAAIGGVPTTDNAAIINNNYNQQMNAWSQQQAAAGSAMSAAGQLAGGLFSLANTPIAAGSILSDERAKTDKKKVGETDDGQNIYSYRYKGSPRTEIGLMAQEVKKRKPSAVKRRPDGLMAVDYRKALN